MTSAEQLTPPDLSSMVPQVLMSIMSIWDLVHPVDNLYTEVMQSTGIRIVWPICKQASRDMLRAVHGLRLVASTDPSQLIPMLRMAQLLRCSQLERL